MGHDHQNTVLLWDPTAAAAKPMLLDFTRELVRVEKTKAKMVGVCVGVCGRVSASGP